MMSPSSVIYEGMQRAHECYPPDGQTLLIIIDDFRCCNNVTQVHAFMFMSIYFLSEVHKINTFIIIR